MWALGEEMISYPPDCSREGESYGTAAEEVTSFTAAVVAV